MSALWNNHGLAEDQANHYARGKRNAQQVGDGYLAGVDYGYRHSGAPELLEALETFRTWAHKAADLNDADHIKGNATKAHKILMALAGLIPGYVAEIDAAHAALAKAKGAA